MDAIGSKLHLLYDEGPVGRWISGTYAVDETSE